MGEVIMATPAISDGVIFIRGLKDVFAIGHDARDHEGTKTRRSRSASSS